MAGFQIVSRFTPQGDQPEAIQQLVDGIRRGDKEQVLLGVTGSGKTFTMAKVIEAVDRPTLVLSHNKTLAAQLYQEFRSFFPNNAVEYFVSYYDYYQPEAYVPSTDTYIEKETSINEEIDRLRLRATKALFERRDVIIVASVSCIYGLGSPEALLRHAAVLQPAVTPKAIGPGPEAAGRHAVRAQRARSPSGHASGCAATCWRSCPAYEELGIRVEFFGDEIERITRFDRCAARRCRRSTASRVYPRTPLRHAEGASWRRRSRASRPSWRSGWPSWRPRASCSRRQRLEQRTPFRPGDAPGDRLLPRHRELLAPPHGPRAGRAAADAARLLPGRLPDRHRRVPPDHPAGPRHVPRRPLAQGDAGELRLPPAVGAGQPAADLRRVRRAGGPA